jgi:hypothetical protein
MPIFAYVMLPAMCLKTHTLTLPSYLFPCYFLSEQICPACYPNIDQADFLLLGGITAQVKDRDISLPFCSGGSSRSAFTASIEYRQRMSRRWQKKYEKKTKQKTTRNKAYECNLIKAYLVMRGMLQNISTEPTTNMKNTLVPDYVNILKLKKTSNLNVSILKSYAGGSVGTVGSPFQEWKYIVEEDEFYHPSFRGCACRP